MRTLKYILLACLLMTGCTAKEILVSKPVDIVVSLDKITGTKVVFSIKVSNQDAHYCFSLFPAESDEYFHGTDKEEADYYFGLDQLSYNNKNDYGEQNCSFTEYACFRGDRTLKRTRLSSGVKYKLIVYQVDPVGEKVLGNVVSKEFTTKSVEKKDLTFDFNFVRSIVTITPSDPERTYYWDFERDSRIYSDFMSPFGYFYSVLDMYDDYGFIDNILVKGEIVYNFNRDAIREGETYTLTAASCSGGEIDSELTMVRFSCKGNSLYMLNDNGVIQRY